MPRRALAVLALVVAAAVAAPRAQAGDPRRVWRTVESAHFAVHYCAPLDDVARRVAVVAERAHRRLAPALDRHPEGKTHIVLIDDNDGANGFASVLPRNQITLYASAPNAGSVLADHDDWLYDLVAHEYTHILHLDSVGGLARLYNRVYGKTWAPNQVMPRWIIEGIATYEESKRSAAGRTRASQFDMYLRVPVLAHDAMRLDEFTNSPLKFPRGNAAYLYGSSFLKYVFDRFGDDTLRKMSWANGSSTVPFGLNRQLNDAIGESFDGLDGDWRRHLRDRATLQLEAIERHRPRGGRRLSIVGEFARNPRYAVDGRTLYWTESDGLHRERVIALPEGGDRRDAHEVLAVDRLGGFDVDGDGGLVFEQTQFYRDAYAFQDLMHWDAHTGRITRLTTAERARDPALSPDGDRIAYSKNGRSTSDLRVLDRKAPGAPPRTLWTGARYDQVFVPAWSPDGTRVAFVAWRTGGWRDILVVNADGSGAVTEITHDRALDDNPRWSADGKHLFFTSDRTGITNLYAYDLGDGLTWQVTNVVGGVNEVAVAPDGKHLAYIDFVGTGWDLFELAIDPAQWTPARPYVDDRPDATRVADDEAAVTAPRPYRPLETLAPQTWTGLFGTGTYGRTLTITTSGADVAGLHGYSMATTVELDRGDVDVGGAYGYSGLRPGVRIGGGRTIGHRNSFRIDGRNQPWDEEILSISGGLGVPVRRTDDGALTLGFDYGLDWIRRVSTPSRVADPTQTLPGIPRSDFRNAGLGIRLSYGNSRGFLYNLGPTEGMEASAGIRVDHPVLGASQRALTVGWFWRGYYKLPFGDTPALALRVTGSVRVSDLSRGGGYGIGGMPQQDVVQSIIDSTRTSSTGYLRGYPQRVASGNTFHLVNLEYRHQLLTLEHGASSLPFYLRRLHGAVLVDAGTAYDGDFDVGNVKPSVGGALRADALFGWFVPGTLEVGVARGLASGGQTDTWLLLTGSL